MKEIKSVSGGRRMITALINQGSSLFCQKNLINSLSFYFSTSYKYLLICARGLGRSPDQSLQSWTISSSSSLTSAKYVSFLSFQIPNAKCKTRQLPSPKSVRVRPLIPELFSISQYKICLIVYCQCRRQQVSAKNCTTGQQLLISFAFETMQHIVNELRKIKLVTGQKAIFCSSSLAKSTQKHMKIVEEMLKKIRGV